MFLYVSNVDEVEHSIQVRLIFMDYGEVSPIELCIGEVLEVIFEFLEVKPGFLIGNVVGVNIGFMGIHWGRERG